VLGNEGSVATQRIRQLREGWVFCLFLSTLPLILPHQLTWICPPACTRFPSIRSATSHCCGLGFRCHCDIWSVLLALNMIANLQGLCMESPFPMSPLFKRGTLECPLSGMFPIKGFVVTTTLNCSSSPCGYQRQNGLSQGYIARGSTASSVSSLPCLYNTVTYRRF